MLRWDELEYFNPMIGVLWLSETWLAIIIPKYHNYRTVKKYLSVFTFYFKWISLRSTVVNKYRTTVKKIHYKRNDFHSNHELELFVLWTWQKDMVFLGGVLESFKNVPKKGFSLDGRTSKANMPLFLCQ